MNTPKHKQLNNVDVVWAILWACSLFLCRSLIPSDAVDDLRSFSVLGSFLSGAGHFIFGLFFCLLFRSNKTVFQTASFMLVCTYWCGAWAAYRYEAFFGHLPNTAIIRFLGDLSTIQSSLDQFIAPHILLLQCIIPALFFCWLLKTVHRPPTFSLIKTIETNTILRFLHPCIPAVLVAFLAVHLYAPLVEQSVFWESRNPFIWFIQSRGIQQSADHARDKPTAKQYATYQHALGHRPPFGSHTGPYPLCRQLDAPPSPPPSKSVILIIVENLGTQEVNLTHQDKVVLPNLQRIIDDGLFFQNIKTHGTRSSHALPPIWAGLPAQNDNFLWQVPLPNIDAWPWVLRRANYKTIYRHGAELQMEQKRTFLTLAGFSILHEPSPQDGFSKYGWGYSDGDMFKALMADITTERENDPDAKFLYSFATLSTHDPFVLPESWPSQFTHNDPWDRYVESLSYFDHMLGQFYDWYTLHEKPKGTLLVITGDQVPVLKQMHGDASQYRRFDVPVVITGQGVNVSETTRNIEKRLGGQGDIPATIRSILALPPGQCDQGLNLLQPVATWPSDRVHYAIGGDLLHQFYVWQNREHYLVDLVTKSVSSIPRVSLFGEHESTTQSSPPIQKERNISVQQISFISDFIQDSIQISSHLMANNGFSPPPAAPIVKRVPIVAGQKEPFVVTSLPAEKSVRHKPQELLESYRRLVQAGETWLYVDVTLGSDKTPIVSKPMPKGAPEQSEKGRQTTLPQDSAVLTLETFLAEFQHQANLVLEVWPQADFFNEQRPLAQGIASLLNTYESKQTTVIVQSFSTDLPIRIAQLTNTKKALRYEHFTTPDDHWLDYAVLRGFDWVTIHEDNLTHDLIARAHKRGLYVMTTNFPIIQHNQQKAVLKADAAIKQNVDPKKGLP